jgi:hypothetical protein
LVDAGHSDEVIAVEFGRSAHAVATRRSHLRIAPTARRWTDAEDELLGSSLTLAEIARRLGRSVAAVANRRLRVGATNEARRWTPEEDARALAGEPVAGRTAEAARTRRRALRARASTPPTR